MLPFIASWLTCFDRHYGFMDTAYASIAIDVRSDLQQGKRIANNPNCILCSWLKVLLPVLCPWLSVVWCYHITFFPSPSLQFPLVEFLLNIVQFLWIGFLVDCPISQVLFIHTFQLLLVDTFSVFLSGFRCVLAESVVPLIAFEWNGVLMHYNCNHFALECAYVVGGENVGNIT